MEASGLSGLPKQEAQFCEEAGIRTLEDHFVNLWF